MNPEEIRKLLKALGIKTSVDGADGTMKEEDAIKLVEEQFKASNLGLVQKRDELLAEIVKQKEKITAMETAASDANKKIGELDAQLKKNSPEENKKFYEAQLQEAKKEYEQKIAGVTTERDKFRESHYTRVKKDAILEAVKDMKFINDAHREGFIAIAETQNQFKPCEADGKTIFTNQENKTIQAVLHELSLSSVGKAFIQNGNQGGNAQGGNNPSAQGQGQGGQTMNRADFDSLSNQAKMDFTSKGGTVID